MSIPGSGTIGGPAAPRHPATPAASPKPKPPPWGGLEIIALTPTIFPALLFIPGVSAIRTPLRIMDFTMVLIVWAVVLLTGGRRTTRAFLSTILLGMCAGWLLLELMHPTTNSPISGLAGAIHAISIMSPVFWVPLLKISPERLMRLLRLVFFANLLSALWGLGQVYQPDRFNPPDVALFKRMESMKETTSLTMASGRKIMRPCGLTDSPGGAAIASANILMIGLIWSLRSSMVVWRRAILVGIAFMALGLIYISQVRVILLTSVTSLGITAGVFALRGEFRKATILTFVLGALVVAALLWAGFVGGDEVTRRFKELLDEDATAVYQKNRGGFVQKTFESDIPRYPLGAGLGRWGQIYYYFGNKKDPFGVGRGELWSEVQVTAWVYDGGVPLLVGYLTAVGVAMWTVFRIALRGNNRDLSFWACVIFAMDLTLMASIIGYMPFAGPPGLQFWLLTTALFVSNEQAGIAARKAKAAAQRGAT